jgi:homospermidine synthase
MNHINKINIRNRKVVFLGYGAVAKCVWNYFDYYFDYNIENIYLVDQYKEAFYGPKLTEIPNKNKIIKNINCYNFDEFVKEINLKTGDIIIDLTYNSNTYYFINKSLSYGFNYINTSIEDTNDELMGTSIELQQQKVKKIGDDFKAAGNKPKSNVLTEFGQNPGMIQHYILYALNKLNQMHNKNQVNDYSVLALKKTILNYKIGTILSSEIDYMVKKRETKSGKNKYKPMIENTWSVLGFIGEATDETELVVGNKNKFIKPHINQKEIYYNKNEMIHYTNGYQVVFLKECGLNYKLNSICPVINEDHQVIFENYQGNLIHHGEIFELAKLFGDLSPFMSYVYKTNKYADESLKKYIDNYKGSDIHFDLKLDLLNDYHSYRVFDNISQPENDKIVGQDSIGCTLFCGEKEVEKIFWCGSILSNEDPNVNPLFTPTIVQVAAGVLSGLSYILENKNKNRGLINPCDLQTAYVFSKSAPLLGKLFFTEIPRHLFKKNLKITKEKYL